MSDSYKKRLIQLLVSSNALLFGDFTLKSGRQAPYFINTGKLFTGESISKLGDYYAEHITSIFGSEVDIIFGPAYKGVPLCVATASSLYRNHRLNASYCFDRKEAKDHGDKGAYVGREPKEGDRVVIVEDVISAGTTVRHVVPLLRKIPKLDVKGVVLSVDRCEVGTGTKSAVQEAKDELNVDVCPILNVYEIVSFLSSPNDTGLILTETQKDAINAYLSKYGVAA